MRCQDCRRSFFYHPLFRPLALQLEWQPAKWLGWSDRRWDLWKRNRQPVLVRRLILGSLATLAILALLMLLSSEDLSIFH